MEREENPFDKVAAEYERLRPGYPEELFSRIFSYASTGEDSRVLEIGSGSGQATGPFLDAGCHLLAVEPGENFSKILNAKFGGFKNFKLITGRFEDINFEKGSFDLIFSATAFHWIPEEAGYEKAYSLLKKGGAFARFANHPFPNRKNPALQRKFRELYDKYYRPFYPKSKEVAEYSRRQAERTALIREKYGFKDIKYRLFYRERVIGAKDYVRLLGTYSDHIAIEKGIRDEFFKKIEEAIDARGGFTDIRDCADLELARKI